MPDHHRDPASAGSVPHLNQVLVLSHFAAPGGCQRSARTGRGKSSASTAPSTRPCCAGCRVSLAARGTRPGGCTGRWMTGSPRGKPRAPARSANSSQRGRAAPGWCLISLGAVMVQLFSGFAPRGCPLRAGPSVLPRVALATTRRETRRPMTSTTTTAGSDADRQAVPNRSRACTGRGKPRRRDVRGRLHRRRQRDPARRLQEGPRRDPHHDGRGVRGPAQRVAGDRPPGGRPLSYRRHGHRGQRGRYIFPGQDAVASERLVRATWVLVRRDDGWRIASYHNSPAS